MPDTITGPVRLIGVWSGQPKYLYIQVAATDGPIGPAVTRAVSIAPPPGCCTLDGKDVAPADLLAYAVTHDLRVTIANVPANAPLRAAFTTAGG